MNELRALLAGGTTDIRELVHRLVLEVATLQEALAALQAEVEALKARRGKG